MNIDYKWNWLPHILSDILRGHGSLYTIIQWKVAHTKQILENKENLDLKKLLM